MTLSRSVREGFGCARFEELLEAVRQSGVETRQNIQRILISSEVAAKLSAPFVCVEGWVGHPIEMKEGDTRPATPVPGGWMSEVLLRLMQRRILAPDDIEVVREYVSRCTEQEGIAAVRILNERTDARGSIIAITDGSSPGIPRARRTIMRNAFTNDGFKHNVQVLSPRDAIEEYELDLSPAQHQLFEAAQLSSVEHRKGLRGEVIASAFDFYSEIRHAFGNSNDPNDKPLVARAMEVRKDEPNWRMDRLQLNHDVALNTQE